MTDLTNRSNEVGATDPLAPTPVHGAVIADVRTLRHVARAEQERLSADAEIERRARAERLDLELREQRRAAARREREADAAAKQARVEQRRGRRAARRAKLRTAAPRWADRALFVLPIMFPMAVAWVGQIRFAMTVMGWPLPAAVVFAAGFELSTAYVARLDWLSRAAGDSALLFRSATWGFAAGAATMNYWHAAGSGFEPNGEAVSYGLMSITGVVLWELLSTYRHRTALRAEGKLPAARPRFGLARWIWFHKLTRLAWLLSLRDGYTTTDLAWLAAIGAVEKCGSVKAARKAVRAGRPVPRPEPLDDDRANTDETNHRDTGHVEQQRDTQTRPDGRDASVRDDERDVRSRDDDRDDVMKDAPRDRRSDRLPDAGHPGDAGESPSEPAPSSGQVVTARADRGEADPATTDANQVRSDDQIPAPPVEAGGDEPSGCRECGLHQNEGEQAVSAKMVAYARQRLAEGAPVTGAELDRQFGTRDYGRRILRRLATESRTAEV